MTRGLMLAQQASASCKCCGGAAFIKVRRSVPIPPHLRLKQFIIMILIRDSFLD